MYPRQPVPHDTTDDERLLIQIVRYALRLNDKIAEARRDGTEIQVLCLQQVRAWAWAWHAEILGRIESGVIGGMR